MMTAGAWQARGLGYRQRARDRRYDIVVVAEGAQLLSLG